MTSMLELSGVKTPSQTPPPKPGLAGVYKQVIWGSFGGHLGVRMQARALSAPIPIDRCDVF